MPIFPDNFVANSLSGTILITDGHANLSLATNPYALEGDKSFVIKLRKGGPGGLVIASSSPITLRDTSSIVSFTANISSVNEGNLVQFTLVTANAVDNSNVYYSVFPATANITTQDFFGANVGRATIISNQATFALRANADLSFVDETGENFRVQLRTNSPVGNIIYATSNVEILDVSKGFNIINFVENSSTVAEGGTLTLTFTATNIPTGTVFHYSTSGNATVSTFTGGNTGSFVMNSLSNTVTLLPTGVPYSTTQNFNVVLRAESNSGAVVATSNNIIAIDSAIAFLSATGGNVTTTGGYRIHKFETSNLFTVTSLGAGGSLALMDILSVGGGGSGTGHPGNSQGGGGGGAGGYVYVPAVSAFLGNLTVTVGSGGTYGGVSNADNGSNTSVTGPNFSNILSVGGGAGGSPITAAKSGGSGGGSSTATISQGIGYGFPSPTQQGHPGGGNNGNPGFHGGGGGAGGQGGNAISGTRSGNGGIGIQSNISGISVYYAGGGGGGTTPNFGNYTAGSGGLGGGGPGDTTGTVNTGGGGGGGVQPATYQGRAGGSGIVIIRYPYVPPPTVSNVVTTSNVFSVGSNIIFTVNAQNANLLTLYYSTDGNVTSTNFIGGNTGSFVANASGGIVTLQANTNIPTNESRYFALQIRQDSTTGFISGSSANVIIDGFASQIFATGGNVITADGYRIHTFTSSNSFVITKTPQVQGNVEILLVGGGGGPGGWSTVVQQGSGGGGAGGVLYRANATLSAQTYPIVVGAGGGGGGPVPGVNGANTTAFGVIALGGGHGGFNPGQSGTARLGNPGGSGGGGGAGGVNPGGNTIQISFAEWFKYGNPGVRGGGLSGYNYGGAGGGAGGAGIINDTQFGNLGAGGAGINFNISGSNVTYAAGGTGLIAGPAIPAIPGSGNGGNGTSQNTPSNPGGPWASAGSPGIVIIRYPYS